MNNEQTLPKKWTDSEKILLIGCLCFFLLGLCFYGLLFILLGTDPYYEIEKGLTPRLEEALLEYYDLDIPDTAEFEKGYINQSFRDPCMTIWFTVPQEDFDSLFADNWAEEPNRGGKQEDMIIKGAKFHSEMADGKRASGKKRASLAYAEPENGRIRVCFEGIAPKISWIK